MMEFEKQLQKIKQDMIVLVSSLDEAYDDLIDKASRPDIRALVDTRNKIAAQARSCLSMLWAF